jgi:hypothetical protein
MQALSEGLASLSTAGRAAPATTKVHSAITLCTCTLHSHSALVLYTRTLHPYSALLPKFRVKFTAPPKKNTKCKKKTSQNLTRNLTRGTTQVSTASTKSNQ